MICASSSELFGFYDQKRKKNSQVSLIIKNIPVKRQRLTSMFNIRYTVLRNQQIVRKSTNYVVRANIRETIKSVRNQNEIKFIKI